MRKCIYSVFFFLYTKIKRQVKREVYDKLISLMKKKKYTKENVVKDIHNISYIRLFNKVTFN